MGILIDGQWQTDTDYADQDGEFKRQASRFRDWVKPDKNAAFPLAADRYHLYVSYACPWAHRVLITRALKGLESVLPVTVVDPFMGEQGWAFSERLGCTPDPNLNAEYLREVYTAADPECSGRVTVPVLWDKRAGKIVNNESRDLVQMLDQAFEPLATRAVQVWPTDTEEAIGVMIDANYNTVNNGVYRAGFATTQPAYEAAVTELFERLHRCEELLSRQPFLCGEQATAADICLFTTLLRFAPVYEYHFKCNLRSLTSFPHLWEFTRALYQEPRIRETCRLDHIRLHYYTSHPWLNPQRIVPLGPELQLEAPVGAARKQPFRR